MKVNNTSLTGNTSVNVESRASKIAFVCTSPKGARTDAATILDDLANAKIEIEKQTTNGGYPILPEIDFTDLIEMASAHDGSILITTEGSNFVLRASVALADEAAIDLKENEFFKITLTAFTGVAVDVYAIDLPSSSATHNVFKTLYCNANTAKNIDVRAAKNIAIPDAIAKKIEIVDNQGRLVSFEKEEMRQICNEVNAVAAVIDGKTYTGYLSLLVIPVANAHTVRVTTTAAGSVYVHNSEVL